MAIIELERKIVSKLQIKQQNKPQLRAGRKLMLDKKAKESVFEAKIAQGEDEYAEAFSFIDNLLKRK